MGKYFGGLVPGWASVLQVVNLAVTFGIITLLFAMIFKYLPDAKIAWGDVWLGSVATASLFMAGKFAIGLYLGRSGIGSAYGAAGSLVVLLVWIYYSSQILFFGAEFTQVYANRRGSKIAPSRNAERVGERVRLEQGMPRTEPARPKAAAAAAARSRHDAEVRTPARVDFPGRNARFPVRVDAASPTPEGPTTPAGPRPRVSGLALGAPRSRSPRWSSSPHAPTSRARTIDPRKSQRGAGARDEKALPNPSVDPTSVG